MSSRIFWQAGRCRLSELRSHEESGFMVGYCRGGRRAGSPRAAISGDIRFTRRRPRDGFFYALLDRPPQLGRGRREGAPPVFFQHMPVARSLVKRAHALLPRDQRVTQPVDIGKILNTIDSAYQLAELYDNPAFGRDPEYYHWTQLGSIVADSALFGMIEIARQVERKPSPSGNGCGSCASASKRGGSWSCTYPHALPCWIAPPKQLRL